MEHYTGNDVTVLMSVYKNNIPNEFREAFESIVWNQTVVPANVVLVVDGEITDQLEKVISDFTQRKDSVNLLVVRLKANMGLARALEYGLQKVNTLLVARMDSDDIAIPERIEFQLKEFNNNQNLSLIGGSVLEFEENISDGRLIRQMPETDREIRSFSKYRSPFNHPTVMFKLAEVMNVGGYKELGTLEDYYLWIRLLYYSRFEFKNMNKVLVYMRAGQNMYARRGSKGYFINILKLRIWMLRHKSVNLFEFIIGMGINTVSIILPVGLRKRVYGIFFRKNIESLRK